VERDFPISELAKYGLLEKALSLRVMKEIVDNNENISEKLALNLKEQFIKKLNLKNSAELQLWLKNRNLNQNDIYEISSLRYKWQDFCNKEFKNKLKTIYLKVKDELDMVSYSLLRVTDENLIRELYQQIYEGEFTFLQIASQYSDGPEKRTGGLIGPVPLNHPHPFLSELLRVSTEGKLSPPIKFDKWWILIRLEKLESTKFDKKTKEKLALIEGEKLLMARVKKALG